MAAIALKTAGRVEIMDPILQMTARAAVDLEAGQPMILDANGEFKLALATSLANGGGVWIAGRKVAAGDAVTGFRIAKLDGFDLSGLAYNAPVYLGDDGSLNTAAGTVSIIVGRVICGNAQVMGNSPDKLLQIMPNA